MGVASSLVALIRDLNNRVIKLHERLRAHEPHSDIAEFKTIVLADLQTLLGNIRRLPTNDVLHPTLQPYIVAEYGDYARECMLIEHIALPVILRYDERDHQCAEIVAAIMQDIRCPADMAPRVTVASTQYYWAQPEFRIISIPIGELDSVLGWPDLIHELAHLLLKRWPDLLHPLTTIVQGHFRDERYLLADIGAEAHDYQLQAEAQIKWSQHQEGTWRLELACDAIATYICGPSYGWQHLRLTANLGRDPYQPSPGRAMHDHPADQARLDTIVATLQILGLDTDARDVTCEWWQLRDIQWPTQPPQGYDQYYPPKLLATLAQTVVDGCRRRNVAAFTEQRGDAGPGVIALIDQAWQQLRRDPNGYAAWEQHAMNQWRRNLRAIPHTQKRGTS